jgi:hypothetical protein
MRMVIGALLACSALSLPAAAQDAPEPEVIVYDAEPLARNLLHPGVVESWDDIVAYELLNPPAIDAVPYIPTNPLMELEWSVKSRMSAEQGGDGLNDGTDLRSSAPLLLSSFIGPDRFNDSGIYPPDAMGAVGTTQFVVFINGNVSIYDKVTGVRSSSVSLNTFWNGLRVGSAFDPRVLFDQHTGRWITIATDNGGNPNDILVAVSTTDNAAGTWFKTKFVASVGVDATRWADYPTLGVDANGIYVSANMFPVSTGSSARTFWAIDKSPLVDSPPSLGAVTAFRGITSGFTLQPAHTYGAPGAHYTVSANTSGQIRVYRTLGPLNSPTFASTGTVAVAAYSSPPDAAALGSTTPIDTGDFRLQMAVHRDGSLWTCHTINVGGRAAARWYELDPVTRVNLQSGTVSDAERAYFYPSIMVNVEDHTVMGFCGVTLSETVGTYYAGRLSTDPAGSMSSPVLLKSGETIYNALDNQGRNRWGDYSYTTLDPIDETTMWTIAEYASTPLNNWGTWIGELLLTLTLPGDLDQDGDVDLADFALVGQCFGGANLPPAGTCPPGVDADLDNDGDVDLSDFATFAQNFTGST